MHANQMRHFVELRLSIDKFGYKNAEQYSLEEIRDSFHNVFWNLIWHFADQSLPYDFLVPYEDTRLYEGFLRVNDHLKITTHERMDQKVQRLGIEKYLKYRESREEKKKQKQQNA